MENEASLGRRLLALLIDWVVASFSALALFGANVLGPRPDDVSANRSLLEGVIVNGVFVVEVALLVGLLGFSIGKRVMGLRVISPEGTPIGVPRALLRTFLLTLIIPAIIMTQDKRGLHDLAGRSKVVSVR